MMDLRLSAGPVSKGRLNACLPMRRMVQAGRPESLGDNLPVVWPLRCHEEVVTSEAVLRMLHAGCREYGGGVTDFEAASDGFCRDIPTTSVTFLRMSRYPSGGMAYVRWSA
jgi:hypothetical protein